MIRETRFELRALWRTLILPVVLVITGLLAVGNVANAAQAVRSDYSLVQHTRAEYAKNGMDFQADLSRPARVSNADGEQAVGNLARFDYDNVAEAIVAISPASSVDETLKYFAFLIFPLVFFLLGLWMATIQRRYGFEKVTLTRAGLARTTAARQLAVLTAAAITIAWTLLVDVISRSIAEPILASQLPLTVFKPLTAVPVDNVFDQWGIVLLVALFFGGGGLAVGSFAGVFAIPAIVFLAWDFVLPILAQHDPRNWFTVLGHAAFNYSSSFELAEPIPLAVPIAAVAATTGSVVLLALGYVGIRLRNPRAT